MSTAPRRITPILAFGLVIGIVLTAGLARLRLDTDVLSLLPADLPTVQALLVQQRHFASSGELFITLEGADPDAVEEAARSLAEDLRAAKDRVRWAVWSPPWEEHPDQAAELLATAWLSAPTSAVRELVARLSPERLPGHLAETRARLATSLSPAEIAKAGYDPLGLLEVPGLSGLEAGSGPRFSSEDGRYRVLIVTPAAELGGYREAMAWLEDIRGLVTRWQRSNSEHGELRVRFTGGPAFTAEISQGMERDMLGSVAGTAVLIAGLFAWVHRRLRPLLRLLALLGLTLAGTLAMGGLIFGRLNAVSLGFAAILLGLAVDYGLVLYQEWLAHPEASPGEIRRRAGGGIIWAALTTAAAFGAVAFAGLPGLTQLGVLVGIGTLLGAAIMLALFLHPRPLEMPPRVHPAGLNRRAGDPGVSPVRSHSPSNGTAPFSGVPRSGGGISRLAWTVGLGLGSVVVLTTLGRPTVDSTAAPLRPRHSEAYAAMEELQRKVGDDSTDPWWVVAAGPDEGSVARLLRAAEAVLRSEPGGSASAIRHQMPTAFWPDPQRHRENAPVLGRLAAERDRLRAALIGAGFTEEAFRSAQVPLSAWERAAVASGPFWPTNEVSAWTLAQVTAREAVPGVSNGNRFYALGFVRPDRDAAARAGVGAAEQRERLRAAGLLVGGWDLLGAELLARVEGRLAWLGGLMVAVWLGALGLAFRSLRDALLTGLAVAMGTLLLLASMRLAGWSWNLMNLMALPLLVGAGTDYAIHLQLALRRHRGDEAAVRASTGRAIFLCAATTVVGFGSLALSSNEGLASLGAVCATGLACIYVVSAHLLPAWWRVANRHGLPSMSQGPDLSQPTPAPAGPSALYGAPAWQAATWLARRLPRPCASGLAMLGALAYAAWVPSRRRVVAANLLPLLGDDPAAARHLAWRNFAAFGRKLADLWRYEAGQPIDDLFADFTGWEHLEAARASGRGVLLVTPHLGNWEFGAPLLAARGVNLLVITLAEPGDGSTRLRQAARARWGIETLVIGGDAFAFVEIIRRLQAGAVVALLIDRPPAPTAVPVTLFGRPFAASVAAAELARASHCHLLPTAIVRSGRGYAAHVLPEIPYDRRQLGNRESRRALTQDILRAFEPWLRQHPEQWFHFVPVWPAAQVEREGSPAEAGSPPSPSSSPSSS